MRHLLATVFTCLLPLVSHAQSFDFCEELWVTRNMMFDRSGYCFGSALGQSLFDNSNCTTSNPVLPPDYAQAVGRMRDLEARVGCRVTTGQPAWPSIRRIANFYNQFWSIPEPLDGGYACWGYTGPAVTLYAGASTTTPQMGTVTSGLSYGSETWGLPGWQFYSVSTGPGGQHLFSGWAPHGAFAQGSCEQEAG